MNRRSLLKRYKRLDDSDSKTFNFRKLEGNWLWPLRFSGQLLLGEIMNIKDAEKLIEERGRI